MNYQLFGTTGQVGVSGEDRLSRVADIRSIKLAGIGAVAVDDETSFFGAWDIIASNSIKYAEYNW
jgi:hypothetical protein